MSTADLQSRVEQTRQRLLSVHGGAVLCWGVLAALVVLLVAIWLDLLWELSAESRIAALVLVSVVAIGLCIYLLRRLLTAATFAAVARRLDFAAGGNGEIVSGWELATNRCAAPVLASAEMTSGLARLAIEQASQSARHIPVAKAAPWLPLKMAAMTLCGLVGGIAIVAACLPSLAFTQFNRFLNPYGDTPPYSSVTFVIEPGDTEVVYGRGLEIRASLSGAPVERVELVVDTEKNVETLPMFPEPGGKWRTSLARVIEPARYFVRADRARSQKYSVSVLTAPTLETVHFRVTPPSYTRDAVYDGPLPKTGILALAGAKVQVTAKSNRPLRGGTLQFEAGKNLNQVALHPRAANSDEVVGEFTVAAGGKFSVQLTDVAGQVSQDSFVGSLTLLEDQRPFVRIMEPKAQSLATPTAAIPVLLSAEDDYGVQRLQLYRSLNDSRPLATEIAVPALPPRRLQEQQYLPLAQYGLQPGDVIKLFARVEDNDPAGARVLRVA